MFTVLLVLHGFLSLCLVALVLLQQGKGADMGATIGGGGSSSVFGGAGAVDFVAKLTTGLAIAFMCTSILLVRAYAYRAPSMNGAKSDDFLKGSLFDEADEVNNAVKNESVAVEDGSGKSQEVEVVSRDANKLAPASNGSAPTESAGTVVNGAVVAGVDQGAEVVLPSAMVDAEPRKKTAPDSNDTAPGVGHVH
jgi:preprotein translocase subunit SecG